MSFGKPGSFLAAVVFAVGCVSGLITLIVSAVVPGFSAAGYGLGITAGILAFLVYSAMIFWCALLLLFFFFFFFSLFSFVLLFCLFCFASLLCSSLCWSSVNFFFFFFFFLTGWFSRV